MRFKERAPVDPPAVQYDPGSLLTIINQVGFLPR